MLRIVHAMSHQDGIAMSEDVMTTAAKHNEGDRMRALVTGCAGFIGSHLCERLLELGHEVVGIDCLTDYYDPVQKEDNLKPLLQHSRFTLIRDDLSTMDLTRVVPGMDLVYHQAAQPGVRASWGMRFDGYVRNNVLATQRLLEASKGQNLKKFVYASSSSVYGDAEGFPTSETALPQPVSPYGVTKLGGEQLVYLYWRNHTVPTISLRYFTVYGPRQRPDMAFHRFIRRTLEVQPIAVYGDGEQTRDFTFVSDAITANILAGESDVSGRVFNVGGGSRVSVNRVLAIIGEIVGRPLTIEHQEQQLGDVRHTSADTGLAAQILGYQAQVDLRSGLTAEVEWLQDRLALSASQQNAIAV